MVRNVLDYLERSEKLTPDQIAFADEKTSCTYRELKQTAKAIGTYLAAQVSPGSPVPVLMEKGVLAVCAFMGAVYAGCFYVMLDPKLPAERIRKILHTLDADLVITEENAQKPYQELAFEIKQGDITEAAQSAIDEKKLAEIRKKSQDTDPLYTMFTSGSTGIPKGVVVSHRSVIDFIEEFTELFGIAPNDVIGNQAPFDFDVSVKDIYSTLKAGATMQIIPKKLFSFPVKLLDYLEERQVTTLIWAVSALCMITTLKGLEYKVPRHIRKVIFSGEVMPVRHLNEWRRYLSEAMYVNVYGPTEITCNCTYYIVDREFELGEQIPIGQAFPNEKVFLLDEQDHLVTEAGKKGKICVAGTALSLGYYRNPEQTKKVFVQNPLNDRYQETIYRTGDLAYYGEDGQLYFATRKDFQIKHMGHRIELGEIEAAMERLECLKRSVCLYDETKQKIVAFYDGEAEKRQLHRLLGEVLPGFMIPNVFVRVLQFPLTKNGKIDRKRLMELYEEGQYERR